MLFCIPRHHNKKKLPSQQLLFHIPHPVPTGLYQRFFKYIDRFSTFISDFFIISTIRHRISTYRQFSAIYLYSIPHHYNKKKLPSQQLLFHIPHPVPTELYQRFFKYIDRFSTFIGDFFIISTIRHRISTYRQFSAIYLCSIPRHYNKKKLPSRQLLFHIPHPVPTGLYQRFFKYIDRFSTYINDFFIISAIRHKISI
ncbi:hypothetical protein bthur0010_47360 [Bacillus thuringiensis serovar pondicheriensis BGSC 4BA1]|nr:hypothetical protein bthur0010_47360 [Bacillus thuringiensis serovar pondicheriensis BGSC 4BA1]